MQPGVPNVPALLQDLVERISTFVALPEFRVVKAVVENPVSPHTTAYITSVRDYVATVRHGSVTEAAWQLVGNTLADHAAAAGGSGTLVAFVGTQLALGIAREVMRPGEAVDVAFVRRVTLAIRSQVQDTQRAVQALLHSRGAVLNLAASVNHQDSIARAVGHPVTASSSMGFASPHDVGFRLAAEAAQVLQLGASEGSSDRTRRFLVTCPDDEVVAHVKQAVRLVDTVRTTPSASCAVPGVAIHLVSDGLPQVYFAGPVSRSRGDQRSRVEVAGLVLLHGWSDPRVVPRELASRRELAEQGVAPILVVVDDTLSREHLATAEHHGFSIVGNVGAEGLWRLGNLFDVMPSPDVLDNTPARTPVACSEHGLATPAVDVVASPLDHGEDWRYSSGAIEVVSGARVGLTIHVEVGLSDEAAVHSTVSAQRIHAMMACFTTTDGEGTAHDSEESSAVTSTSSSECHFEQPLAWTTVASVIVCARTSAQKELIVQHFWSALFRIVWAHRSDDMVPGCGLLEAVAAVVADEVGRQGKDSQSKGSEDMENAAKSIACKSLAQALQAFVRCKVVSSGASTDDADDCWLRCTSTVKDFLAAPLSELRRGDPPLFTLVPTPPLLGYEDFGGGCDPPPPTTMLDDVAHWTPLSQWGASLTRAATLAELLLSTSFVFVTEDDAGHARATVL